MVDSVPIDPNCDWHEQDIRNAIQQAYELEEDDPDAARYLLVQAHAAKAKLDGREPNSTALEPYDPMRLQARLLRHYNGGITDSDFTRMDYRRFFGYVRELDIMLEEEERSSRETGKTKHGEMQAALNQFPQPEEYTGETIPLI